MLHKTKNSDHLDSVSDISISPTYFEWATGSYDGHVRVFRHPSKKQKPPIRAGGGGGIKSHPVKIQKQSAVGRQKIACKDSY